jgi:hypothetical protein
LDGLAAASLKGVAPFLDRCGVGERNHPYAIDPLARNLTALDCAIYPNSQSPDCAGGNANRP